MPTITSLGQLLLDQICDEVAAKADCAWLNTVGAVSEVDRWLATKNGKPIKSIAGAIAHLVAEGMLHETRVFMRANGRLRGHLLEVTHDGWKAWSRWNDAIDRWSGAGNQMPLEEWEEWDGLDGTHFGFEFEGIEDYAWTGEETKRLAE